MDASPALVSGAAAPCNQVAVQQFNGCRQTITPAMQGLQVNTRHAQGINVLPDSHSADAQHLAQRFTGMKFTIRKKL